MRKILPPKFFNRKTTDVAKDLLGKFLVIKNSAKARGASREVAAMITEVEAYDGFKDKASHARKGQTARNAVMFGEAGHWYIYFCYGMYWMLNIVTGPKDYPAAILIRGVIQRGSPSTRLTRSGTKKSYSLSKRSASKGYNLNGPGKLTKFLQIDKRFNGKIANKKSGLWIEDRGNKAVISLLAYLHDRGDKQVKIKRGSFGKVYGERGRITRDVLRAKFKIKKSPRIGVGYAGPIWSKKHYRFFLDI